MTQEKEFRELMEAVAQKSLSIFENIKAKPDQLPSILSQYIEFTKDYQAMVNSLMKNPEQLWQSQMSYWQEAVDLNQQHFSAWMTGKKLPSEDKRFAEEEWTNNPFFNLLSQHYSLANQHVNSLLDNMEYEDKQAAKRIQFFSKLYLDALSPANYLYTNPTVLKETMQSGGKNLLKGMNNFLSDVADNPSQFVIKMTDMQAFEVGKNLAITPGKVIYRNEMMELIQYTPSTEKVYATPLLIIPPWINKYYILDLSEENSIIRYLVAEGFSVCVISWVNPDARFAKKSFYDYLEQGPLTAIDIMQKQFKVKQVNTLGFCIGGTLQACLLAYLKAHQKNHVHSATFLASMIDFSDPGDMSVFIDEEQILHLEKQMQTKGYLDGKIMAGAFNSLRANDLIWSFFIKNYLQGRDPVPFDILYWNADATNMPAKMHSEYLRWMYLHNQLIKPNQVILNNTPLDVTGITTQSCFISTIKDHIAPWQTTYLGFQALSGDKKFILGGSGHIAGIINPPSKNKYEYYTNPDCAPNAEAWLQQATKHEGSWWPEWVLWLKKQSKKRVAAPTIHELPFKPIMDAPGTYVLKETQEK